MGQDARDHPLAVTEELSAVDLLTAVGKSSGAVSRLITAGHGLDYQPLNIDAHSLQHQLDDLLGPRSTPERDALNQLLQDTAALREASVEGLSLEQRIYNLLARVFVVPPPTPPNATWTFTFPGGSISGRAPMPVSILDSDIGWSVAVGNLTDAAGEPAAAGATIAFSVDDASLITLTDNGDGTAKFDSALAAPGPSGISLPASTGIHATATNPDGTSFTVDDVITVVAGDAVTGDFTFTPPA